MKRCGMLYAKVGFQIHYKDELTHYIEMGTIFLVTLCWFKTYTFVDHHPMQCYS